MHDIMKELDERIDDLQDAWKNPNKFRHETRMHENMIRVLELHKQVLENWQFMFEVFKASQGIDELVNGDGEGSVH